MAGTILCYQKCLTNRMSVLVLQQQGLQLLNERHKAGIILQLL
ncbi:hypothetical protein B6N60_04735 [Richelia sinica FACHB-800]|uniref:Uncharacterized protein n=1 Tax=Richelia sinica FACHB-800 TaxID=1357546 RepID=A0A975Y763_9NOST|nr:hypothetical protein B6N60_04735 [Richelia sinica FACHB-800]